MNGSQIPFRCYSMKRFLPFYQLSTPGKPDCEYPSQHPSQSRRAACTHRRNSVDDVAFTNCCIESPFTSYGAFLALILVGWMTNRLGAMHLEKGFKTYFV